MCFSLLQASRCRVCTVTSSWFESFPNSTRIAGSSCSLWLLRSDTCGVEGRHIKKWIRRYTTTKRVVKYTLGSKTSNLRQEISEELITKRTKLKNSKSEISKFQLIDYGDILPKLGEPKDLASLATVIVFDLETTGFSGGNDRVIEIGLQDLRGGEKSCFQTLVNPERCVPNTKIHGISDHMVNRPGVPRMEDLIPVLLKYIKSRQKPGGLALLVGHNARSFDVRFLTNEFIRFSYEIPPDWLFLDTLPLARQAMKSEGPKSASSSLKALRQHYDIPSAGSAHRAMSDVKTLALVLQGLTRDLKLPVSGLIERSFRASINL